MISNNVKVWNQNGDARKDAYTTALIRALQVLQVRNTHDSVQIIVYLWKEFASVASSDNSYVKISSALFCEFIKAKIKIIE